MKQDKNFDFNQINSVFKNYLNQINEKNQHSNPKEESKGEIINSEAMKFNQMEILKPLELENYLKKYIIGQNKAISIIATKIATHYNRMLYELKNVNKKNIIGKVKNNILLIGPTGVGKTYIIKLITEKLGIPFAKGDATKYTETGYVGGEVEDLVRELFSEAKTNNHLADYGIIYLDEVDKIAAKPSEYSRGGPDISRAGVQRNLLKIMEEAEVSLKNPIDMLLQMQNIFDAQKQNISQKKKINTKNILFVMSGAFHGIEDIIQKRISKKEIGFQFKLKNKNAQEDQKKILKYIQHEDLIEYGFESEFVGRLPIIVILNHLKEEDFYKILKNPKCNIILNKIRDFEAYNIKISFSKEILKKIAKIAYKGRTGARNLVNIIEKYLILFERSLPSIEVPINELIIDLKLLKNPKQSIKILKLEKILEKFAFDFNQNCQIDLKFSKSAKNYIYREIPLLQCNKILNFLSARLQNYNYALKLINKHKFIITKDILLNYKEYLNNLTQKF